MVDVSTPIPLQAPRAVTAVPARASDADRRRIAGLDWIRGVAALWVLVYHVDITLQKAKYFELPPLSLFTSVGYRGVELFFLLSGFVMAKTYAAQQEHSLRAACSFGARRLLRIFPAYLVVFLPLFALAAWKGLGAPPHVPVDAQLFFTNLLLLPRDDLTTYIPVNAWTLTHELMFYALFMVAFVSWRAFLGLLSAWALLGLACAAWGVRIEGWQMATSGLNAYFLLGIACSRFVLPRNPAWVTVLGVATLAGLGLAIALEGGWLGTQAGGGPAAQLAYAAAFALVICTFASGALRLPSAIEGAAAYLGRISYGLYLVNYPVVVAIALACKAAGLRGGVTLVVAAGAVALSILLADLMHRFVERPCIELGKRLFHKAA